MDGGSSARNVFTTIAAQAPAPNNFYVTNELTTPLVIGDTYNFMIIAQNVVGNSTPSHTFSAMAAIKATVSGIPTKITASTTSINF